MTNPIQQAIEALEDITAGWKYIRSMHGDLYGVGWDRAQGKAEAALASLRAVQEVKLPPLPDHWIPVTFVGLSPLAIARAHEYAEAYARAAIAAAGGGVPQGWKLVPVEPTREMLTACKEATWIGDIYAGKAYRAMLAAAPEAPAQRCPYCDDTGDVHTPTGEWRGRCTCPAGTEAPAQAAPSAGEVERAPFTVQQAEIILGHGLDNLSDFDLKRLMTKAQDRLDRVLELRAALSHKEQP